MTDHTAALRERFGFWIKSTEITRVIHWNGGGCRPSSAVENALWDALAHPQQPKIDVEHLIRTVLPGGYSCDPQAVADDLRRYFDAWEEPKPIAWKTTHKSVCPPITEDKAIADAWREAGYPVVELFGQPQQPAGWRPIETAPKDGSEVLLWLGAPWSKVEKARWYAPWSNWQCGTIPADPVREECHGIGQAIPTHWMPLPTPPGAHPSQQEDELRKAVQLMAGLLKDGEWAEILSSDPDVAALEAEISRLIGAQQEDDALDAERYRKLRSMARKTDYDGGYSGVWDIRGIVAYDAWKKINHKTFDDAVDAMSDSAGEANDAR